MKVKVISSFDHGSRTLRRGEVIEVSAIQASALRGRGLVEYADGGDGAFVPRDSLPGADTAAPPANPPPAGGEAQPSSASLPAQAAPQTTAKRSRGGARAKAAQTEVEVPEPKAEEDGE